MKTTERNATADPAARAISCVVVVFALFLAVCSLASVPLCVTAFGQCFWFVAGILNLTASVGIATELYLTRNDK